MIDLIDHTLKAWRQSAFIWGETDCLLSVGDYIAAAGGRDVASRFRGTYTDEQGATALLEAHGGLAGMINLTGLPEIASSAAVRGDVVVFDPGDGEHLAGLCTGPGIAARTIRRTCAEIDRRFVTIHNAWGVSR